MELDALTPGLSVITRLYSTKQGQRREVQPAGSKILVSSKEDIRIDRATKNDLEIGVMIHRCRFETSKLFHLKKGNGTKGGYFVFVWRAGT
jgi:hypothetical protein